MQARQQINTQTDITMQNFDVETVRDMIGAGINDLSVTTDKHITQAVTGQIQTSIVHQIHVL
jgi:hypothetical protein